MGFPAAAAAAAVVAGRRGGVVAVGSVCRGDIRRGGAAVDGARVGGAAAAVIGPPVGAVGTAGANGNAGADVCRRRVAVVDRVAACAATGALIGGAQ